MGTLKTFIKRSLLFTALVSSASASRAQTAPDLSSYPSVEKKLQAWADYCELFVGKKGFHQDYPRMLIEARKGLNIVPDNLPKYKAIFTYYLGVAHEFTGNDDSAVNYLQQAETYAAEAGETKKRIQSLNQLINCYFWTGRMDQREQAAKRLQMISDTLSDEASMKITNDALASYHYLNSEFETALGFYLKSLELAKKKPGKTAMDTMSIGLSLSTIADIYTQLGQPRKALDYWTESTPYVVNCPEAAGNMKVHFLGLYLAMDRVDSATVYFKELQGMKGEYDNTKDLAEANLFFASYYLEKHDLVQAQTYTSTAALQAEASGSDATIRDLHTIQGQIWLKKKNWSAAITELERAAAVTDELTKTAAKDLQLMLSQAYAGTGNWQQAYLHSSNYAALADTLAKEATKRNLAEMEARYQNNDKQTRIELLNKESRLQQKQRLFLIGGILLLLALAGTLAVYYRNKRRTANLLALKNTQLDNANQTKARLFSIISHDLRTPVSQLFQFLQLQQISPGLLGKEQQEEHNRRITGGVGTLLETMEDILVWSKTQMERFEPNFTKVPLHAVMEEVFGLLQPFREAKNITIIHQTRPALTARTDENMLKVILRNIVQNAIQHAPAGSQIVVDAHAGNEGVTVSISDEGSGLPDAMRELLEGRSSAIHSGKQGLGLQLVRELCERLGIKILAENKGSQGTMIALIIPASVPGADNKTGNKVGTDRNYLAG